MKIGLIGLGTMGGAYAKHLLKCNLPCYGIEIEPKNQKEFIWLSHILPINILLNKTYKP